MKLLLTHIKELLQVRDSCPERLAGEQMKYLPTLKNAWLYIEHGLIKDYGTMEKMGNHKGFKTLDCSGKTVLPAWCDSHSHIVYAGNREQEFVDRINGLSYQEIAEKGGGIVNSAKKLQQTSEEDLYEQSANRLKEVMRLGTGAIEIKSGYGLTVDAELKMLRVANKLKEEFPIDIKTSFLGAHAIPTKYKNDKNAYIDLICQKMLPKVAEEKLADYVDVFCELGYFTVAEMELILLEAKKYDLIPKVHVNQFN